MQQNQYDKEPLTAVEAQRLAQEIAFGPIVFQVSRLMLKFGIFQLLADERAGMTQEEISKACGLSSYATQVLLEASLTIGTVLQHENRYRLAKAGWFLLNDRMVRVNMDFNHDVNYLGMFHLEEALTNGRPGGLKVFGEWSTIYEGLSSLPSQVQKSWFGFDHYYSDCSFDEALAIVFARHPKTLLDVGGNTGRWATKCVSYDDAVEVTIMDLPQQLEMMRQQTKDLPGAMRIHGYGANLLDPEVPYPRGKKADELCAKFCAEHTCDELEEIFNKAGIPCQRAYGPADIEKDPQYEARENIVEWDDQCFGKMKGIGVTNIFKKNPSQIVASAPCFGEHNREVLKDFGYTDEEIDALYKKGELATWTPADTARNKNFVEWHFFWDPERQAKRIGLEYPPKK